MTAYFGMMAHYVNAEWELVTELISFEELEGSHSGENQAAHVHKVLKRFGILAKVKILSFVFIYLHANIPVAWILHW